MQAGKQKNTAGGVTLREYGWECDGDVPILPIPIPIPSISVSPVVPKPCAYQLAAIRCVYSQFIILAVTLP